MRGFYSGRKVGVYGALTIELRQKQYAYYRDLLLSFKEAANGHAL